jgi:hypothetical protein
VVKTYRVGGPWGSTHRLDVAGRLEAVGTAAAPVVMTYLDDDGHGVSTSGQEGVDGTTWGGVGVQPGGHAEVAQAVLAGAPTLLSVGDGATATVKATTMEQPWAYYESAVSSSGDLTLTGSELLNTSSQRQSGVSIHAGTASVRDNDFVDMGLVTTIGTVEIKGNRFTGLPGWKLRSYAEGAVDATGNFWGRPEGPRLGTINSGSDVERDEARSVLVDPWCIDASCA